MKTIVIEVSGGVVQEIYADKGTRVVLVDWDDEADAPSAEWIRDCNPLPLAAMPDEAEVFIATRP